MKPKYLRIRDALAADIAQGGYKSGELLPSEAELMRMWGVSRTTARGAIRTLVNERLAYTIQGVGTYTAENPVTSALPGTAGFSEFVRDQWRKPSSRIVAFEYLKADTDVAYRLELAPRGQVLHLERVLLADDVPVSLSDTYLSVVALGNVHERLTADAILHDGLYGTLQSCGFKIDDGYQTISACAAGASAAAALQIEKHSPLTSAYRVGRARGVAIEYSRILTRPDQAVWGVALRGKLMVEEPLKAPSDDASTGISSYK